MENCGKFWRRGKQKAASITRRSVTGLPAREPAPERPPLDIPLVSFACMTCAAGPRVRSALFAPCAAPIECQKSDAIIEIAMTKSPWTSKVSGHRRSSEVWSKGKFTWRPLTRSIYIQGNETSSGRPHRAPSFPYKGRARHPRGDRPFRKVGQSLQGGYRRTSAFSVAFRKLYE